MSTRKLQLLFNPIIHVIKFNPRRITLPSLRNQSRGVRQLDSIDEVSDDLALDPFLPVKQTQSEYLKQLNPPVKRSFNLAAYVNQSKTLQELIKLGVSLYDVESTNTEAARRFVTLDFQKDCVPYIQFLVNNGLKLTNLGRFISEFPRIFDEHLDDLQTRLNYFEAKGFSRPMIAKALNRSSRILSYKTKTIDYKLGHLQIQFHLGADSIRTMVVKHPNLIAVPETQFKLVSFTLTEEFGFNNDEIRKILESQPALIELPRPILIERLDLVHNKLGLSHETIMKFPKLITGPKIDIGRRFDYLKKLKRNQFNPLEPLYVPPSALYSIDDEEFCSKYAKTSLEDYKLFLKSC